MSRNIKTTKNHIDILLAYSQHIDMNAKDDLGNTAFMIACIAENVDVVKLLLEHSSTWRNNDYNSRNNQGQCKCLSRIL